MLWAWVAEGLGDIPIFFHHPPTPQMVAYPWALGMAQEMAL